MFYQFVSPILSTKFSQFEQLKKKEKILLVQNIFHKFRIPNIRIFLFQLTNLELSKEQIHKVSTNIFPITRLISSRVTKKHMTQTGTCLLVVFFCILKRKEDMNPQRKKYHSRTVTIVCNVFSLDYIFFPTRRLACYVSHYGAFFQGYCWEFKFNARINNYR